MGGRGSGGSRAGAGRKPKSNLERLVTGDPGHRGRLLAHPNAGSVPAVAPVEEFDAPNDLSTAERLVWLELAPFAFAARTLLKSTSYAFRLLCRNIVLERELSSSVEMRGTANHRGIVQRVDAELLRFSLCPNGKAVYEAQPDAPVNKLDRFTKKARA